MARPEQMVGTDGSLCIVQMHFLCAGVAELKHVHSYGHWFHLSYGRVSLLRKGVYEEYSAPVIVWIEPNDPHHIIALMDGTVGCCILDTRDPNVTKFLDG